MGYIVRTADSPRTETIVEAETAALGGAGVTVGYAGVHFMM